MFVFLLGNVFLIDDVWSQSTPAMDKFEKEDTDTRYRVVGFDFQSKLMSVTSSSRENYVYEEFLTY